MHSFAWNPEKNQQLIAERGFSFEEILAVTEARGVLDDVSNPSSRYPDQRMLIVDLNGYAVVVPYVQDGDVKFLKTAFYSRRATRLYREE